MNSSSSVYLVTWLGFASRAVQKPFQNLFDRQREIYLNGFILESEDLKKQQKICVLCAILNHHHVSLQLSYHNKNRTNQIFSMQQIEFPLCNSRFCPLQLASILPVWGEIFCGFLCLISSSVILCNNQIYSLYPHLQFSLWS